jgi:hypothetical protein
MKEKNKKPGDLPEENIGANNPHHDDSLNPIQNNDEDQPEIYKISRRGKSLNRKEFIKTAAGLAGLAALGSLLQGCTETELDIVKSQGNCTCHAVCTCNSEVEDEEKRDTGNEYFSFYDEYQNCTCDTVCTCDSVCTCDTVKECDCDSDTGGSYYGGGYYYTYWYPN